MDSSAIEYIYIFYTLVRGLAFVFITAASKKAGSIEQVCYQQAVSWLRRLIAGLSPRRPGFATGSVHVGFLVGRVILMQLLLQVLPFLPVSIIPPGLHTHTSPGG
jgi:hypothetical protein